MGNAVGAWDGTPTALDIRAWEAAMREVERFEVCVVIAFTETTPLP